jgi:hypothetical protein
MKKIFVILVALIGFGICANAQNENVMEGTAWKGKGQWRYWTIEFYNGIVKFIDGSPMGNNKTHLSTIYSYDVHNKEGKIRNYDLLSNKKSGSDNTNFSLSEKEMYLWSNSKAVMFIFERVK